MFALMFVENHLLLVKMNIDYYSKGYSIIVTDEVIVAVVLRYFSCLGL